MRAVVENRHVGFAKQAGDGAQRAAEPAVEKHRVLASQKFRDAPFEFAMQIGHSREHGGSARSESMRPQGFMGGRQYFGVISKTKVIVGAEIDDGARFPAIANERSRICA